MASMDTEIVYELWEIVKPVIPAKEKLEVAERIIKLCDDNGFQKDDIEEMVENDKILETAFDRYFVDDYEDEDDDDWDDYD